MAIFNSYVTNYQRVVPREAEWTWSGHSRDRFCLSFGGRNPPCMEGLLALACGSEPETPGETEDVVVFSIVGVCYEHVIWGVQGGSIYLLFKHIYPLVI